MLAAAHSIEGSNPHEDGIPPSPAVPPPSLDSSLWRRVLAAEISEKDQRIFMLAINDPPSSSTTWTTAGILEDILTCVEAQRVRCQHNRWKTKSMFTGQDIIVRDVCAKIAVSVRRFMGVVGAAASFDPVHAAAALPWAGVRFVLQMCANSFDIFGALVEGLERAASIISRGSIVESLYLDHRQSRSGDALRAGLEDALGRLFSAVVRFLCRAKMYHCNSLPKKVTNLMTKQSLEEALRTIRDAEDRYLVQKGLVDGEGVKTMNERIMESNWMMASVQADKAKLEEAVTQLEKPVIRAADHVSELHDTLSESQRTAILDWLSPIPVQEQYRSALMGLLPGSGEWLLNGTLFETWRDSSASESFWLHGIPGCGKSKIAAAVIQHLRAQGDSVDHPAPIAHFFCSRDSQESERSDAHKILRSVVKQLSLTRNKELIRRPTVDEYQKRRRRADLDGESLATLTADECVELIYHLSKTTPMAIVIDALDECTSQDQEILLSALDEIQERSRDVVKIFVTSRHIETITANLQDSKTIEVTEEMNRQDLKRFIKDGVDQFIEKWSLIHGETRDTLESLRGSISQELMKKSQEMFLWVSLQLDTISDVDRFQRPDDIVDALGSLPSSLNSSYTAILERIASQGEASERLAKSAFRWLLCAKRPLTCSEFIAAVGSLPRPSSGPASERPSAELIVVCCNNLVTIEDASAGRQFRLVHSTVRDHLESLDEFSYESNHSHVGHRCLETYSSQWDDFHKDGLLPYSTQYGLAHVEVVQKASDSPAIRVPTAAFFAEGEHFEDWLKTLEGLLAQGSPRWSHSLDMKLRACFSSPPSPLFAICCFGLLGALQDPKVGGSLDLEQKNRDGTSGLYLAARFGHTDIIRELLLKGVVPNAPGHQYGTAIPASSSAAHDGIAKLWPEEGARIPSNGGQYSSPLQAALANGHEAAATILLDNNFPYTDQKQYNDALETAIFKGQVGIVQRLLEGHAGDGAGQDASHPDLLQVALYSGKSKEARALLQSCPDINAQRGYFGNALSAAIAGQNVALVKEVVASGAKLDRRGRSGYPVRAAAATGRLDVARYLLEHVGGGDGARADPNAADRELGDALQAAASRGDCEMMLLLLLLSHGGADVGGSGGFFGNALQAATFGGHEPAVRLLLEHGAVLEDYRVSSTWRYRDAVQAAVHGGHEGLVALLLDKDADLLPGKDTDLLQAPRLLPGPRTFDWHRIERYALPAGRDGTGQLDLPTRVGPLEVAARCGNVRLIRLLIERGADVDAPNENYDDNELDDRCVFTALQIAAFWGHAEAVECLLDARADINAVRQTLGTPLHAALEGSRLDVVGLLLRRGADIDRHWMMFGSCLQVYAERGNLERVRYLHELGASLNDEGGENGTALQVACDAGHIGVVTYLLDNGAEINAPGRLNGPALQAAAASGHVDIVELLLDRGAHMVGNKGSMHSPLQDATAKGHEEVVRMLLQRGARVDTGVEEEDSDIKDDGLSRPGRSGNVLPAGPPLPQGPPLHLAAWYGHEGIVEMLLDSGADVHGLHRAPVVESDHKNSGKRGTALWVACVRGNTAVARALFFRDPSGHISRGSLVSAVKASLDCDRSELAAMLVREGTAAGLQYEQWADVVDLATEMERVTFLEQVFESHPLLDWTSTLHKAATGGRSKVVQLLLNKIEDVNGQGEYGRTALEILRDAIKREGNWSDWMEIILADAGADLTALNGKVHDVAIAASREGKTAVLETLEGRGLELFPDAEHHSTALSNAAEFHHVASIRWLCRYRVPTSAVLERAIASVSRRAVDDHRAPLNAVQALLDVKVPLEITENGALLKAVGQGHTEIVKLLLRSATPPPSTAVIKRALKKAIRDRQLDCFRALLEPLDGTPVEKQQLSTCAVMESMPVFPEKIIVYLLGEGVDPNLRGSTRRGIQTLLYAAVASGNSKGVRLLLEHGADINLASAGPKGTALHEAAAQESKEIVELLLKAGADPNSRGHDDSTPLSLTVGRIWYYCQKNFCAECCARLLLDYGADVDAVVKPFRTMIDIATKADNPKAVKELLERGADPNVRPREGQVLVIPENCVPVESRIPRVRIMRRMREIIISNEHQIEIEDQEEGRC